MDREIQVVGRFFKVLVPGSQTCLKIPPAFTKKLNFGVDLKVAVLTSCKGSSWKIDVTKCRQGFLYFTGRIWERYVSDHELKIGDIVVFEHTGTAREEGRFHFNTLVFDHPNCCNKNFAASHQEDDDDDVQVINGEEDAPGGSTSQDVNSQFQTTLRKFHFKGFMSIPAAFAKSNGLSTNGAVTLRNVDTGDSWVARISVVKIANKSPCSYRANLRGLDEFLKGNELKVGDECIFKLQHPSKYQKHVVMMDVHFVRN